MATPTKAPTPSQPRFSEELQKMEYEPINSTEKKLIWYTFFSGIALLVILVWVSSMFH